MAHLPVAQRRVCHAKALKIGPGAEDQPYFLPGAYIAPMPAQPGPVAPRFTPSEPVVSRSYARYALGLLVVVYIVNFVDHGEWSDGRLFLAMEWLEGEDLAQRQKRLPLGMQDSVEVVRRVAQALAAIHSRGIVHRDMKLSNMFLVKGRGTAVDLPGWRLCEWSSD